MEIGHYLKHAYIPCKSLLCSKSGKERILKQLGSFSCLGRRKQLYLFRFTALFTQVTKRKNGCCLIRYPELDFSFFFIYIYDNFLKKKKKRETEKKTIVIGDFSLFIIQVDIESCIYCKAVCNQFQSCYRRAKRGLLQIELSTDLQNSEYKNIRFYSSIIILKKNFCIFFCTDFC